MADQPQRRNQYIATFAATLAVGIGTASAIGWSSPAEEIIKENFNATDFHISWISSMMPIGAACAQIYVALTLDRLGRRITILSLALPFTLGWLVLAFAPNIPVLIVGRFITGFTAGAMCVAGPTYVGEITDKNVRGKLSVIFLLPIGILLAFSLGEFKKLLLLTLPLAVVPILFGILFLYLPESPAHLYAVGKVDKAEKSMQFFRGKEYNITAEMKALDEYTKEESRGFWEKFKTPASIKTFIMLLVMHVIQQLSGINAIMFFAHSIFEMAGSKMNAGINAIILAFIQVVCMAVSAVLIDRAGRKLLWILSLGIMTVCLCIMAIFFSIKRINEAKAERYAWIPLIVLCTYLGSFALGCGPLPWVMIGELLPKEVKVYIGPFIASFNWILAFIVTNTFSNLVNAVGADIVFWFFAAVSGTGVMFVILFLIETKNKTLDEIQTELGTGPT